MPGAHSPPIVAQTPFFHDATAEFVETLELGSSRIILASGEACRQKFSFFFWHARFLRIHGAMVYENLHEYIVDFYGFHVGKYTGQNVCVARDPSKSIQREAKKRGRRKHFGHWGSWSFVMLGSWVLHRTPSHTRNPKP